MIYAVFPDSVKEITVYGLTQWDKGRKLQITLPSLPSSFEVHFANKRAEIAYVVKGTASGGVATVSVPNIVLMNSADVVAWVYDSTSDDVGETIATINLPTKKRTKPADYYYTEDELVAVDYVALANRVSALEKAGSSGATTEQLAQIEKNTQDISKLQEQILDLYELLESGGSVVKYSVTNTFTDVTSDNESTSIIENKSYVANLIANEGYELNSVTVTMGGVDITSTAYSNGVVSIEAVTGDIIIEAIATPIPQDIENTRIYKLTWDGSATSVTEEVSGSTVEANDTGIPVTVAYYDSKDTFTNVVNEKGLTYGFVFDAKNYATAVAIGIGLKKSYNASFDGAYAGRLFGSIWYNTSAATSHWLNVNSSDNDVVAWSNLPDLSLLTISLHANGSVDFYVNGAKVKSLETPSDFTTWKFMCERLFNGNEHIKIDDTQTSGKAVRQFFMYEGDITDELAQQLYDFFL